MNQAYLWSNFVPRYQVDGARTRLPRLVCLLGGGRDGGGFDEGDFLGGEAVELIDELVDRAFGGGDVARGDGQRSLPGGAGAGVIRCYLR